MGKVIKLIALAIFSCFGISYGAEYDIKTITTIMDAYEKQVDSIKLEYTYTFPIDEEGNREFVKGTFAQKLSEGYVLLDERKQTGKTWDDDKESTGIVRSYNGQITRYYEHEKNKHDYHVGDLRKNHNPTWYETAENPYYRFYRINSNCKLTDVLNDPNLMVKILGEESIGGFKAIKISLNQAKSRQIDYVWLLPEKNYLPIQYKITRVTDGSTYWQINWSAFKEFAGGIWFPGRMELSFGDVSGPTTITVDEIDISPLTKEDFEFKFPAFTHVTDHLTGTSYLTTATLDKYLESSQTTNSKGSDVIDADVKLSSQADLKEKSSAVPDWSYWTIMLAFIFAAVGIMFVFTRRRKA